VQFKTQRSGRGIVVAFHLIYELLNVEVRIEGATVPVGKRQWRGTEVLRYSDARPVSRNSRVDITC